MSGQQQIQIVLPHGTTEFEKDNVMIALAPLMDDFSIHFSPVQAINITAGMDPWQEIDCPTCQKSEFVTINHSLVVCNNCCTEFTVRPTSGDQGFVVTATTKNTDPLKVYHEALMGCDFFIAVLKGDPFREWLVNIPGLSPVNIEHYLIHSRTSRLSHTMKVEG